MFKNIIKIAVVLVLLMNIKLMAEKYVLKSHKMDVEGTSTVHDWKVPVQKVSANADITMNDTEQNIKSLYFEAMAMSLKSEKGESMDEKIYEALKAEDHPKITYKLSSTSGIVKTSTGYDITSKGNLTIAGSTKPCDMLVKAKVLANGDVEFTGSKKVKLSEYGMERPSAMMGVIKCGDDITINFSIIMKK